jgi:hypothetical protein
MTKILPTLCFIAFLSVSSFLPAGHNVSLSGKTFDLDRGHKGAENCKSKITPEEWAKAANDLLDKNGGQFRFSFDSATCDKIKKLRDERKDPTAPIRLGATLKSVDAEAAKLALPEPQSASDDCGGCFMEIPVLQLTDKDFVTVVNGRNIKFVLPLNFNVNEAARWILKIRRL